MASRVSLVMGFATSLGGTRSLTVQSPRVNLVVDDVLSAASSFMLANPFDDSVGQLTELVRAERVSVTSVYVVPPPA